MSQTVLIRGVLLFDLEGAADKPPMRDIVIERGRVSGVYTPDDPQSPVAALALAAARGEASVLAIDGREKLAMPGLVNAHYHSYDTLAKGRFEDMPFDVWALHAQPVYWGARSREELRLRTLLGGLECLRHGITTVQDMHSLVPRDEETLDIILAAYAELGIRVVFSIAARDLPGLDIAPFLPDDMPGEARALVLGAPGNAHEEIAFIARQMQRLAPLPARLHWAIGPSGPQRCSRTLLEGLAELSDRQGLPVLTHAYETRAQLAAARRGFPDQAGSLVQLLSETGLLTNRTSLAHGVYLSAGEIEVLAEVGAGVVHNPVANLKLKNGLAPLSAFHRAGVNLALGCDNVSCGDSQNLFQAMKLYTLLAAGSHGNPTGILAADAIRAATLGGARALGLAGEIGAIRPGMRADIVLLDLTDLAWQPFANAARQMVYCETGRSVDTVLVEGEVVVSGGRATRVDEAAFRAALAEIMPGIEADFAALRLRQAPAIPYLLRANAALVADDVYPSRFLPGPPAF